MNLYSFAFVIFLCISLLCYYTVFRKKQWVCLLFAGFVFYLYEGLSSFLFLFTTALSTWLGALLLDSVHGKYEDNERRLMIYKRVLFWTVLLLNFGILAYLKYWNAIFHTSVGILLPLGISFYIFQSMGYLIDVYNKKYEAQKNPAKFMLFVSFFPQLIQGPINRYDELSDQLYGVHKLESENIKRGIYLFVFGLMKKYAIANMLFDLIARILDGNEVESLPGSVIAFGIVLYAIYQYADFSGGIDMVLGVAAMFGIVMAPNFKQPYFATSLADFWRRWHISLGHWMKDYVFYPFTLTKPMRNLGKWAKKHAGKHMGRVLPAVIGNLLVFFLVGIWHGPQLHFVAWGLYNGIIIGLGDLLAPTFGKLNKLLHIQPKSKGMHVFRILRTFFIVNIGGYFDRIENVPQSFRLLGRTFTHFNAAGFMDTFRGIVQNDYPGISFLIVIFACVFIFVISVLKEQKKDIYQLLHAHSFALRVVVYYVVIALTLISFVFAKSSGGFMYANF